MFGLSMEIKYKFTLQKILFLTPYHLLENEFPTHGR